MEELQSLLEKINRDGVEKAEAEAKKILASAQVRADQLVAAAKDAAARAKLDAEKASADYAARAGETLRQAARDTVLTIQSSVTALLEKLLAEGVDKALSDEATVAGLVTESVKGLAGSGEIAAGGKLAAALKARLAGLGGFTVVLDETVGSGFTVHVDGGRIEHSFTGETVAAELAKRLRPDLAALLK